MSITPEQARELLDGATPGPWRSEYDNEIIETNTSTVLYNTDGAVGWGHNIEHDVPLIAAAPDLAQTIAGMRWEYAVEDLNGDFLDLNDDAYSDVEVMWTWDRAVAEETHAAEYGSTLVRRLAGPVEVVDGE